MLTVEQSKELVARGFSRRNFGRLATMIAAGSTLPFYNEQALAQLSMIKGGVPADAVKIDANENPMGPCPEALEAIHKAAANGGRYDYQLTANMTELLAEQEGVKPSYVKAYPGSSAPLHHAVLAFTSPHQTVRHGRSGLRARRGRGEIHRREDHPCSSAPRIIRTM